MEVSMIETKIFKEPIEIIEKLAEFSTSKEELRTIIHAAIGGRMDAVPHDPKTAAGTFSYIYGTRELRNIFAAKGWIADGRDNIESIHNPQTGTKIIFQNTDCAAQKFREPKAISGKGSASERVIALATLNLFAELEEEDKRRLNGSVWYFCVAANNGQPTAELSRPYAVEGGQFSGFIERIFILEHGEWENLNSAKIGNELPPIQDFEIEITRK